jgi:hypothetical protein
MEGHCNCPEDQLLKELGREQTIDLDTEAKLLSVGKQPMEDVLIIIQDTGMRPERSFEFEWRTSTGIED